MDIAAPGQFQWVPLEVYNRLRQWWNDISSLTRGRSPAARAVRIRYVLITVRLLLVAAIGTTFMHALRSAPRVEQSR